MHYRPIAMHLSINKEDLLYLVGMGPVKDPVFPCVIHWWGMKMILGWVMVM